MVFYSNWEFTAEQSTHSAMYMEYRLQLLVDVFWVCEILPMQLAFSGLWFSEVTRDFWDRYVCLDLYGESYAWEFYYMI